MCVTLQGARAAGVETFVDGSADEVMLGPSEPGRRAAVHRRRWKNSALDVGCRKPLAIMVYSSLLFRPARRRSGPGQCSPAERTRELQVLAKCYHCSYVAPKVPGARE